MKQLKFKTQLQNILNTSEFDLSYKRAAEQLKVNVSLICAAYLTDHAHFSPPPKVTYGS